LKIKFIIVFIILTVTSCTYKQINSVLIDNGITNFSNILFDKGEIVKLDGDWIFWPDKLLSYNEVINSLDDGYRVYKDFPCLWQKLTLLESKNNLINRGTFVLRLKLPKSIDSWSIRVPNAISSTTLYLNETKLVEIGKTSNSIKDYIPNSNLKVVPFTLNREDNILIMHVSNYLVPYTGTWDSLTIGRTKDINHKRFIDIVITSLISGALLIMGVYHLALYLLRRKDKSTLWFSLICILMSIRNLITGERILIELLPVSELMWRICFSIEHLSAHLTLPLFFLFFSVIFPKYINKIVINTVLYVAGLWLFIHIFTPPMFHHRFLSFYEYFLMITSIYLLSSIIRAFVNREDGALISLAGMLFLFSASINDVLLSNEIIDSIYLAPIGLLIYTLTHSFFISKRFSTIFHEVEIYSNNLKTQNRSLERFIPNQILLYLKKNEIVDVKSGDSIKQEMAVLILDREYSNDSFSSLSDEEKLKEINLFTTRFGTLITRCNGFIEKYTENGFIALFPSGSGDALKSSLYIRTTLLHYNNERMFNNLAPLKINIGIDKGEVLIGTVGDVKRLDSIIISDTISNVIQLKELGYKLKKDIVVSNNSVKELQNPEKYRLRLLPKQDQNYYVVDWA